MNVLFFGALAAIGFFFVMRSSSRYNSTDVDDLAHEENSYQAETFVDPAILEQRRKNTFDKIQSSNILRVDWNKVNFTPLSGNALGPVDASKNRAKTIDESTELRSKIKPNLELSVGFWWLINFYVFAQKKGVYQLEIVQKTQGELLAENAQSLLGAIYEGAQKGLSFGDTAQQIANAAINAVLDLIKNTAKENALNEQRTALGKFAADMVVKFGFPPTSLLNFAIWAGVPQLDLQNPEDWFRYFQAILKRAIELEYNVAQFAPKNMGRFYQKQNTEIVAYPLNNNVFGLKPFGTMPRSWFWYAFDTRNLLEHCLTSEFIKKSPTQLGQTYTALVRSNQNAATVGQFDQNDWSELWGSVFQNEYFSSLLFQVGYDPVISFQNNQVDLLDFTDLFPPKGGTISVNHMIDQSKRPSYMASFALQNFVEDNWLITSKKGRIR